MGNSYYTWGPWLGPLFLDWFRAATPDIGFADVALGVAFVKDPPANPTAPGHDEIEAWGYQATTPVTSSPDFGRGKCSWPICRWSPYDQTWLRLLVEQTAPVAMDFGMTLRYWHR